MRWNRLSVLSMLLLAACATTRPYPLCQYNGPYLAGIDSAAEFVKQVSPKSTTQLTPSNLWLLINTSSSAHKQLEMAWPNVACLGSYTSDVSHAKYAACLSTMKSLVGLRDVSVTAERSDSLVESSILFCNGSVDTHTIDP